MSAPILHLTILQRPVFLVNSRYPLVSATHLSSRREVLHPNGHTFSRSYGVILPSSLARVFSSALACSAHLPVLVCGTVTRQPPYEAFLGSMESLTYGPKRPPSRPSALMEVRICLHFPPIDVHPNPITGSAILLRPPFGQTAI